MSHARTIVAWQPVLTDHMAYTLMELARAADADLRAVSTAREDATRRQQGWSVTDLPSLRIELLPRHRWVDFVQRILRDHPDAIHIVVSPFGERRIIGALLLALLWRREVYLVSEPYSPVAHGYFDDQRRWLNQLRAWLRPLLYRCYGALIRRRLGGVFAISPLAVRQYRQLGIPADRVFPFGYFVPPAGVSQRSSSPADVKSNEVLRLVFVGSLIRRKGVDALVTAVHKLAAGGVQVKLDMFGPGDVAMLRADGKTVCYRGRIPFGETGHTIADYDVLVLPSLHDGWGVVVNEAIQVGVPVACSAQVGASAIVRHAGCGWVFETPDASSIAATLAAIAADRSRLEAARSAATITGGLLAPSVAGQYMNEAIQSVRTGSAPPPSPWYRS